MKFLSELKNKNLSNQICLLRVDFNIEDAELSEKNLRIQAVLPTIKFLNKSGAKVVILSHRGRPKLLGRASLQYSSGAGRPKANSKQFSLRPFATILSKLLEKPVHFIDFKKGFNPVEIKKIITTEQDKIFLLENLRFFPGEEKNDKKFAKKLALSGDLYINDAFSVSHRKDASIFAITKFMPSYAGFCLENEIKNLSRVIRKSKRPLVIIIGGAKISDKIGVFKNFMNMADKFLIGGDYERELSFLTKLSSTHSTSSGLRKIILPVDSVSEKGKILDIGPKTIQKYAEIIKNAKTVIWNGPMGYIENPKFVKGTEAIIKAIIKSRALAIIGGGETISSISNFPACAEASAGRQFPISKKNIFISTGGGAMLEYLAGKKLPGIAALNNSRASLAIGGKH